MLYPYDLNLVSSNLVGNVVNGNWFFTFVMTRFSSGEFFPLYIMLVLTSDKHNLVWK